MAYLGYLIAIETQIGDLSPIVDWRDTPYTIASPGWGYATTAYVFPAVPPAGREYWWNRVSAVVWVLDPGLPSPVPHDSPAVAANARDRRTDLLFDCDWTQLPDVDLTSGSISAFATYRQALRDVPQQPGFPNAITWPVRPAEIKP